MPAAVVRTQGAANSEDLHCIVGRREDGTLGTVTADSVPKGRAATAPQAVTLQRCV